MRSRRLKSCIQSNCCSVLWRGFAYSAKPSIDQETSFLIDDLILRCLSSAALECTARVLVRYLAFAASQECTAWVLRVCATVAAAARRLHKLWKCAWNVPQELHSRRLWRRQRRWPGAVGWSIAGLITQGPASSSSTVGLWDCVEDDAFGASSRSDQRLPKLWTVHVEWQYTSWSNGHLSSGLTLFRHHSVPTTRVTCWVLWDDTPSSRQSQSSCVCVCARAFALLVN